MLEEHENQETSLQDLIDLVERDDLPTNEFTIQDKDPMVILGKLNEVIANLKTLNSTINASDTKANEALQQAIQAVTNAIEATSTANTALTASNTALSTANTAISTANTAISSANSAVETASNAVSTANTANTTANEAKSTAQEALDQVITGQGTKVYRDTQLLTTLDIKPIEDDIAGNTTAITALQNGKVDKVAGKQLSTEDYTTAEKTKLAGLSNYDDTQVQADLSSLSSNITNLSNQVKNDFVKQGLVDINNCNAYEQLYTLLSNSPNGTGVGDIGYASTTTLKNLLPTIPFSANYVKVYAKITAGNDNNAWVIELSTIDLYSNGQIIPTYKSQIGKNIVDGVAQYHVSDWYDPQGEQIINKNANYIKYKSGLTIQTGTITTTGASAYDITLPIAMPSANYIVVTSVINYKASEIALSSHLVSQSETQFKICLTYNTSSAHYSKGATYRWVAICLGV